MRSRGSCLPVDRGALHAAILDALRHPGTSGVGTALVLTERLKRESLLRNSLFIMATMVANSAFGYLFWLVAARMFSAEAVGLTAAVVAAGTLITLCSTLGVGGALIQTLPERQRLPEWCHTFWAGLVVALVSSLVGVCALLVLLPLVSSQFVVLHRPAYAAAFAVGTVAMTLGTVLDYTFIAERVAGRYFSRNAVVAGGKLLLAVLFTFALGVGALSLIGAWAVAAAVGIASGVILLVGRVGRLVPPSRPSLTEAGHQFRSRVTAHQAIGMGGALLPYLLPLLVTARLSARQNAYFYTTWMMASVFLIIAPAVSQSLFAEGAHSPAEVHDKCLRAVAITGSLLVPCVWGVLAFGHLLLSGFGVAYAVEATGLLRILAIAALPDAVTNTYVALLRVRNRLGAAAAINIGMGLGTLVLAWAFLPAVGISAIGWAFLTMQALGCVVIAFDVARARRASNRQVTVNLGKEGR